MDVGDEVKEECSELRRSRVKERQVIGLSNKGHLWEAEEGVLPPLRQI